MVSSRGRREFSSKEVNIVGEDREGQQHEGHVFSFSLSGEVPWMIKSRLVDGPEQLFCFFLRSRAEAGKRSGGDP